MGDLTLYQLTGALKEFEAVADDEMPEEAVRDTLEALRGEVEVKAADIILYGRNQEALAWAIEDAAKAMKERAARIRRRIDWLHSYVLQNMRSSGISKIETPQVCVSVQKNPPSVVIDTDWLIPEEFLVQPEPPPPKPDKKAICDAIKSGKEVPGCHLEQSERLKIK